MKRDLRTVAVPFPNGLMSSARSPLTLPVTFARELTNMVMGADGAGMKRNGVAAVGEAIGGEDICAAMGFMAAGGYQLLAATDAGKIYRQDGEAWEEVYSGLSAEGVIRTVTFGGRLLLCNGVDDVIAYDGTGWEVVRTFVTDAASGLSYLSGTQFSIESDEAFYAAGRGVKATLGSGVVSGVIDAVSVLGDVVTVTLSAPVLDNTLSAVQFEVRPPKVNYLCAAHDRLWGFGLTAVSAQMSSHTDRLRVFYTYGVNDPSAWPDTETGVVPGINLADKAGVADELLAMAVKDNMTIFMSRNHMQIWTGSTPGVSGDLAWAKTIPLGVVHGNAVLELPNDLLFMTRQGMRTLSRTVQTEQLDISDVGAELDPTVAELLGVVMADEALYRRVVPLRMDEQGWLGIALSDKTLVWQIGAFGKGWVVFDGAFGGVGAAHAAADGTLYVAKGGQLYAYDTGCWDDDGEAIETRWRMGWFSPGNGKRWGNFYVEPLVMPGSAMGFTLKRYRDFDDGNPLVVELEAPVLPQLWDEADWDNGLWDSNQTVLPSKRDHVVAEVMSFAVESAGTEGPFGVFGIKLYGESEK